MSTLDHFRRGSPRSNRSSASAAAFWILLFALLGDGVQRGVAMEAVALAASHKLQVNDPAVAERLVAQGAKLIADYGNYALLQVSDGATNAGATAAAELRDDPQRFYRVRQF